MFLMLFRVSLIISPTTVKEPHVKWLDSLLNTL